MAIFIDKDCCRNSKLCKSGGGGSRTKPKYGTIEATTENDTANTNKKFSSGALRVFIGLF